MNVQKVLKELGVEDIEVEHTDLGSAWPGIADLIVCGNDLYENLERFGDTMGLMNIMDKAELTEKLTKYLTDKGVL